MCSSWTEGRSVEECDGPRVALSVKVLAALVCRNDVFRLKVGASPFLTCSFLEFIAAAGVVRLAKTPLVSVDFFKKSLLFLFS